MKPLTVSSPLSSLRDYFSLFEGHRSHRRSLGHRALIVAIVSLAFVALITGAVRKWSLTPARTASTPATVRPVGTISVKITPTGFEPSTFSGPGGSYLVAVYNRAGLKDVELLLDRRGGSRLSQAKIPPGKLQWTGVVELAPGKYVLTEASHPEWSCQIVIGDK